MGRTRGLGLGLALLIATLSLVACATMGDPPPTLYKRLGGREGIAARRGDLELSDHQRAHTSYVERVFHRAGLRHRVGVRDDRRRVRAVVDRPH